MGLGKTIQTICYLEFLAREYNLWGTHLIVVPNSVILNWKIEFQRWCPGFNVLVYSGDTAKRQNLRKGW